MVRMRIKITRHDGTPMKPLLIRSLCDVEVFVNKIIEILENKEAFFVITDNKVMDTLLRDENRQLFAARGLDIQYPPEYEAARTVSHSPTVILRFVVNCFVLLITLFCKY